MERLAPFLVAIGVLIFGCGAGPSRRRPKVDVSAMREAMRASREKERLASSASYAHFLISRLARNEGDSRRSIDELRLALASDDGDPFLLTSLAEEYARMGDLARAEAELKKVLERRADYHPAQLLMGKVLLEARRYSRARFHLRRAIRLRPREPEAYLHLAQLALARGSPDEAVRVVEELAQALPGEPSGYKRLGLAMAERGDLARAQALLERAAERDPGDFETWAMLAQIYGEGGRLDRAEAAFDRALERDPDNRDVLLSAGKVSLAQGSTVRARAYFDRLLLLSEEPEWALKVAHAYLTSQQPNEAAEVLDAAWSASPDPKLAFSLGLVRERLKRFVQAADAYADVPGDSELFQEARLRRARCLSQAGQHARALALFEQVRRERPDLPGLYTRYARALERAGRAREAVALLEEASSADPSPELLDALATLHERQGRRDEALQLLLRAVSRRPRDEELLYALGAAYERRGELDRAIQQMRAVLAINPKNAAALNFIGYTLADANRDLEEAERVLTRALELEPDNGAFLDSMGWLYYRRGDSARAVSYLERAVERIPDDPLVREHLGDAYRAAGRRDRALEAYRRALEELLRAEEPEPQAEPQRQGLERKLKLLSSEPPDR